MAETIQTYEYGAMSSKFSCEADNKLTAYAAMCHHYNRSAHMIAIYAPEEAKEDSWLNLTGKISARLHEIFGGGEIEADGKDAFDRYCETHLEEIKKCMDTIKRLI